MNIIQIFRRYYLPAFLMYAVIATAIFGIALLLFPENRTNTFWFSLGIAELVLTMPFLTIAYVAYPKDQNIFGHRTPAILMLLSGSVSIYVAATFLLLAFNALVYDLGRGGLILQILLTACFIVFALSLQVAVAGAEQGTETFENPVDSPAMIASRIQSVEQRLSVLGKHSDIQASLKSLREDLTYKFPSAGKITSSELYQQFAARVRVLTENFSQPNLNDETLQNLKTEAEILRTEIPVIQQSLK